MRASQLISAKLIEQGDAVEFQSDLQTDKGPATGTVLVRDGDAIAIKFSAGVEWFDLNKLEILELVSKPDNVRLWLFA